MSLFVDFCANTNIIASRLVELDVYAPRNEIVKNNADCTAEVEPIFQMEIEEQVFEETDENTPMDHPIAETLDICMEKMFCFLDRFKENADKVSGMSFFKALIDAFDKALLPSHDTHHVQFLVFYFCSFEVKFSSKVKFLFF